jgi:hypothetical protein
VLGGQFIDVDLRFRWEVRVGCFFVGVGLDVVNLCVVRERLVGNRLGKGNDYGAGMLDDMWEMCSIIVLIVLLEQVIK